MRDSLKLNQYSTVELLPLHAECYKNPRRPHPSHLEVNLKSNRLNLEKNMNSRRPLRSFLIATVVLTSCLPRRRRNPTRSRPGIERRNAGRSTNHDRQVRRTASVITFAPTRNLKSAPNCGWSLKAGSILEDDDQQGLAHLVEHMAFNGTKNFPKNETIRFMESLGMRFGADVNAYTSFDETVYMLTVPTDKPEMMDEGDADSRRLGAQRVFRPGRD